MFLLILRHGGVKRPSLFGAPSPPNGGPIRLLAVTGSHRLLAGGRSLVVAFYTNTLRDKNFHTARAYALHVGDKISGIEWNFSISSSVFGEAIT